MKKSLAIVVAALQTIISSFNAAAVSSLPELPEVAQNTDVHTLSRTYCKALWTAVNAPAVLSYGDRESESFSHLFAETVAELQAVLKRIHDNDPVMIGDEIILHADPITEEAVRAHGCYIDKALHANLQLALTSMNIQGKHKGASDYDAETQAHVSEVLVYVWSQVKEDPSTRLVAFLIGLYDAAPTCIQGYSVRMLCAVHPPKQKAS